MTDVFNFCAGPAMLPAEVMREAQQDFVNWKNCGCSVMEISHRSKPFIDVAEQAEQDLRDLLNIPSHYKVLFLHGGGRGQFAAVPLNLTQAGDSADFINTGSWSTAAQSEAAKYIQVNKAASSFLQDGLWQVPEFDQWELSEQAKYVHYCPNETVDGIEIHQVPNTEKPLVADMSSCILSKPLDVNRFGVIYAGAQKNIGPSGLSLVIVREDLVEKARKETPSIFDYALQVKHDSMYNTPPTFAWYLAGLVFKWLKEQGGVASIENHNRKKAEALYHCIDQLDFYHSKVATPWRSRMNVPFYLANENLNEKFLAEAEKAGLKALKGHRSVGGMRASIYNAMPMAGVDALVSFMHDFARRYG